MGSQVELVIRNGQIVDGTGAPSFIGDIAIDKGVIKAISRGKRLELKGAQEINATGRVVAPGWVDVHTHIDGQITWDPLVYPFTSNGVTTAIMGNCGVGFAPCKKEQRTFLMELMEGVEDIPLGCMQMGIAWNWESFPEFLDHLDTLSLGCDVAALIGHGPVRAFCLGDKANMTDKRGAYKDPSKQITPEEIQRMAAVVREAVGAGAIGFSTSRTLLHRDKWGTLVPGTLAAEEELLAIGKAVAEGGGGVFEMASDFMSYDDAPHTPDDHITRLDHFGREWIWIEQISKGFGIPVTVCLGIPSVLSPGVSATGFRQMFRQAGEANRRGSNIKLQVFTRPQGVQMCWQSRSNPFVETPTYGKILRDTVRSGKKEINKAIFRDSKVKADILAEINALINSANESGAVFGVVLPTSTDNSEGEFIGNINGSINGRGAVAKFYNNGADYIFKWTEDYEPKADESAAAVATRIGKTPLEVVYDWLCERDGSQVLSYLFMNYNRKSLNDTTEMLFHPDSIPGLGDSGAHAGFIVDSNAHTFLLTHYVRDRTSGPRIPIEFAVKLHTADTANYFGLKDRGVLQEGKKADINIINMAKLKCLAPEYVHDLPMGASRWIQKSDGYDYTILSGKVVYQNGQHTGLLPGKLVRNPNRGKGVPAGYMYGSITGNMSMWINSLKLETRQAVVKVLMRAIGPDRLTSLGDLINSQPLQPESMARL